MKYTIGRCFLLGTTFAALAGVAVVAVAQPATGPGMMGSGGPGATGSGGPGMMGSGGPGTTGSGGPGTMGSGGPGTTGSGGPGTMGSGGPGMMGGYWNTGAYLDALKTQLAITPNEEPAWAEYADTVSGLGKQVESLHQTMFESMGTASWQERRNLMNQMFQAQQQTFGTVKEAATKLMSALDPAQRTKAQSILPGFAYGRGMMGQR